MSWGVPILMYHALSAAHTAAFRRWTLAPDRFEAHLDYLSRCSYSTITIAELVRRRPAAQAGRDRVIVLTFDDAYADFHSVALPLLIRYGMTATLFVPTGHVGGRSRWMCHEGEGERALLSWTALTEIASCGIESGTHSHTHPELDRLPASELTGQVRDPKTMTEDRLGVAVTSFAYPYGHYDRRVRQTVAAAGYSGACTMATRLAASHSQARRAALRARRSAGRPARYLLTWITTAAHGGRDD